MAFFTYLLQPGVFATTDLEPPVWLERYSVTPAQEILIRAGANLIVFEGQVMVIDPVIGVDEEVIGEAAPEPPPEPEP